MPPESGQLAHVGVEPSLCVGATVCALAAPAVFTLDVDARGVPAVGPQRVDAALLDAVARCPTQALSLHLVAPAAGPER